MTQTQSATWTRAAALADVTKLGVHTANVNGHVLALFVHEGDVYAVDNRCPHMGFPLDRGSVHGGILTCHWHHARFDLCTGGAFDLWADDVPAYPVEVRDGDVYVDLRPRHDPLDHQRRRLTDGLERNLSLVIAKAVITLIDDADDTVAPFLAGVDFGTRFRMEGWGQGLTILTVMQNLLPSLRREDRARALYQGLAAVAADTAGHAPRFLVQPLPGDNFDTATLKRWFRQFIEVRDNEGAERCLVSAIRAGASPAQMADMLFAAVTDHRYIDVGHPLDFTNKAFEALDVIGWEHAAQVLTSLAPGYANAMRMEESNAWRHPIDLVDILHDCFAQIPAALAAGAASNPVWTHDAAFVDLLLGDDPRAIGDALLSALRAGATPTALAQAVSYAAALRIARCQCRPCRVAAAGRTAARPRRLSTPVAWRLRCCHEHLPGSFPQHSGGAPARSKQQRAETDPITTAGRSTQSAAAGEPGGQRRGRIPLPRRRCDSNTRRTWASAPA
jgi:nitrite reductase/ring-hydroxylating ferredoxin subunit